MVISPVSVLEYVIDLAEIAGDVPVARVEMLVIASIFSLGTK